MVLGLRFSVLGVEGLGFKSRALTLISLAPDRCECHWVLIYNLFHTSPQSRLQVYKFTKQHKQTLHKTFAYNDDHVDKIECIS